MIDQYERARMNNSLVPVTDTNLPSTEVIEPFADFDGSMDIRDYLEVVARYKWLVLSFFLVTIVTTLVVSLSMTPLYKANGRLELSIQAPKVTKFEDMQTSQLQTREFIQTNVKLLQSETLARRVVERLHLDQSPVFNPALKGEQKDGVITGWKEAITDTIKEWMPRGSEDASNPAMAQLRLHNKIETKFAKSLEVQPERDTTIISLAFSSPDAPLSRDIVNALVQEYISWQVDKKIDASVTAKQQLEKQLEVARIQLERAESNLNSFAHKAGIVSLSSNLNLIYRQLEEINNTLAGAESDRIGKEAVYKQAQKSSTGTIPSVIENQLVQRLREEHVKVVAEYQELYATFKDDYPKVKTLKARTDDIEKKIAAEENRILESLKNGYLTAVKKEESLRTEAEAKRELALNLNDQATQYKILEREVETNKLIHQSLLERSKEIDARVGTELGNIQVVDYGSLPLKPYKPRIMLNMLLACVIGLMGGVGLAFLLEFMDNTIKHIDEVSNRFQIPILGVLPMARPEELADLDHLVVVKPRAGISEAIRTAKVSIQLSNTSDQQLKILVTTSTAAGEGKSTFSSNLAQAFATSEERVLLIDADLRKPRLHRSFGTNGRRSNRSKGLSQYLSGSCGIDDAIQSTDLPGLFFMSAGPIPPNPAELLASNRMRQMLESLGERFDRIIIDAPPAAGFADVLVLGHLASGVILISTLGQTHREALRIFRRSLSSVHGRLLGCIVNKLTIGSHYGGYYYKYYKYYSSYYQPSYQQEDGNKLSEKRNLPRLEEELTPEPSRHELS